MLEFCLCLGFEYTKVFYHKIRYIQTIKLDKGTLDSVTVLVTEMERGVHHALFHISHETVQRLLAAAEPPSIFHSYYLSTHKPTSTCQNILRRALIPAVLGSWISHVTLNPPSLHTTLWATIVTSFKYQSLFICCNFLNKFRRHKKSPALRALSIVIGVNKVGAKYLETGGNVVVQCFCPTHIPIWHGNLMLHTMFRAGISTQNIIPHITMF